MFDFKTNHFEPISFIETPFKERFGTPRQPSLVPSSWGRISLRPELVSNGALEGLEGFSHVWLIFVFHQNVNKVVRPKVHPPRLEGKKMGLFATRTPHRPNPIGLSAVKLEKIEGGILHLSGVDLLDGTPILDIKPYLPSSDSISHATAGWTTAKQERTLKVEFTHEANADLQRLASGNFLPLQNTVREVLELDPRPVFYRGSVDKPNPYTELYGFRLDDLNIVYRMNEGTATVVKAEPWTPRD